MHPTLAFSPDGSRAVIAGLKPFKTGQGCIEVWDVDRGVLLRTLKDHKDYVTRLAFSSDGRLVLSASRDGDIRLWELMSGKELSRFQAHTPFVLCLAFTPDGRHALSGHPDNTVVKWALPR